MKSIIFVFLYISLTAAGHLLLKFGAIQQSQSVNKFSFGLTVNPFILLGVLFWVSATFVWIKVLQQIPLHLAYSLTSVNYILIPILAALILKESMTNLHWIGISLITVGLLFIFSGQSHWMNLKS